MYVTHPYDCDMYVTHPYDCDVYVTHPYEKSLYDEVIFHMGVSVCVYNNYTLV